MESWICALFMVAGVWLIGRAIIIESTADINEMGVALVMGALGMVLFASTLIWVAWRVFVAP